MKNQDFTIIKKEHQSNLNLQTDFDVFDLETTAFRRLVSSKIEASRSKAKSLNDLHNELAITVKNISNYTEEDKDEYKNYRDKTANKIKTAVKKLLKIYKDELLIKDEEYFVEDKSDDPDADEVVKEKSLGMKTMVYWENSDCKNLALNSESTHGMPIARAMAYKLVKENLKNLLPPSEIDTLEPYFEAAEKSLKKFAVAKAGKINASEYRPYAAQFIPKPVKEENHKKIFTAIETNRVIKAKYQSIHGGIPEEIIFSPQQIRVQFMQTQVVGFAHNATTDNTDEDRIGTHVSDDGVYRHLTINRFSDIQFCNKPYKIKPQPMKDFDFVAFSHQWVTNNLENLMLGEDQVITDWDAMSTKDKELLTKLREKEPEKWSKVTATIQLPEAFLDFQDGWDAWFFVNAISMYGADMLVVEPPQVVGEIKRRLVSNNHAYFGDA